MKAEASKTMKSQARAVYSRKVKRQTFLERVVSIGATRNTAKSWWQQFSHSQ
jgi:hypothetical protein